MAKSIRSKRRRKMRAVKRVRYGEKELERLKKTIANDPNAIKKEVDVTMKDLEQIAEVSTAETIKNKRKKKTESTENDTDMEDDSKINQQMRRKSGSYPVWMHQRKIRQKVKAYKKKKKINKKKKSKK